MIAVTRDDINAVNQTNHIVKYKLELLDAYLSVISEVTASAKDVTFNIDAESNMRRTGTMTLIVDDSQWVSENFELSWMDKFVRFSVGLMYNGSYRWYAVGTMIATDDAFSYDETTNELQLTLTDIMGYLNEERGSQIGTAVKISMDSVISELLDETIARYSLLKRTDIEEFPDVIPYDLEFSEGVYPYEILDKVLSLFPWYEQYFDVDGVYHAAQIPMRINDPCIMYADDLNNLIISEKRSLNFSGIKNTTEIWGKRINADYVASNCVLTNDSYVLSFLIPQETVENNKKYCFTPNVSSPENPTITINLANDEHDQPQSMTLPLYDSDGEELEAGAMVAGTAYVARCLVTVIDGEPTKAMYLMGQKSIHVIVREMNQQPTAQEMISDKSNNACDDIRYIINPDSPYACDRYNASGTARYSIPNGEIRQVLKDGDYASIYTTKLAYARGEYENYLKCRMNTAVELTTILIPWVDVNQKIEYTSPTTGETHQYIIKEVNMDISNFKMTMKLSRFYNYYPFYDD